MGGHPCLSHVVCEMSSHYKHFTSPCSFSIMFFRWSRFMNCGSLPDVSCSLAEDDDEKDLRHFFDEPVTSTTSTWSLSSPKMSVPMFYTHEEKYCPKNRAKGSKRVRKSLSDTCNTRNVNSYVTAEERNIHSKPTMHENEDPFIAPEEHNHVHQQAHELCDVIRDANTPNMATPLSLGLYTTDHTDSYLPLKKRMRWHWYG